MVNNFTKKKLVRKIIIILTFLTIFNFIYPYMPVIADDDSKNLTEQDEEIPGGVLLTPITSLITSLCEGVISVCQQNILGMGASSIHVTSDETNVLLTTLGGAIIGAGLGALLIASGPVGWVAIGGATIGIAGGAAIGAGAIGATTFIVANAHNKSLPDDYYLPIYNISPQEIFSDMIPALHVNFINPTDYEDEYGIEEDIVDENGDVVASRNTAKELAPTISKWYVAIRNIVLVGLMAVLLYIGIRIVISSTSNEKAKYKERIRDWLVAVIILVFMHYIMAFGLTITGYITQMLNSQNNFIIYQIEDFPIDKVADGEDKTRLENLMDGTTLNYPVNLMGLARIQTQLASVDENGNAIMSWEKVGYVIIYAVLTILTVMFLVIYFKRVIYLAFLTIIAPLVALTYPIDKISDGQAQAFNMWLKEYMYNLLLQPFHLLLYTILVGSAMELAQSNMIYAIVAIGFLLPAETLLRKFFGFEKAGTTGTIMGGAVGGAMAMTALNSIGRLKGIGHHNPNKDSDSKDDGNVRTADRGGDSLFANAFGGNQDEEGGRWYTTKNDEWTRK